MKAYQQQLQADANGHPLQELLQASDVRRRLIIEKCLLAIQAANSNDNLFTQQSFEQLYESVEAIEKVNSRPIEYYLKTQKGEK